MKQPFLLLIAGFLLLSCKTLENEKLNPDYTKNCFYVYRDYICLHFYNSGDHNIFVPEHFLMNDKELALFPHYYTLKNDTLYIRTLTGDDISNADSFEKKQNFTVIIDSIELKKGERTRTAFKMQKNFNVIVVTVDDNKYTFGNCVEP